MLLSTGERISCALAAMVINDLGHEAISLTGSQAGIVTDTSHTKARILEVQGAPHPRGARRRPDRAGGRLPGRVARLARRHHARAAAARTRPRWRWRPRSAPRSARSSPTCAGVFSADPRIVPDARKLPRRHRSRRCSRCRRPARACCSCARSSTRATTASRSTADRASRTDPVPSSVTRRRPWNDRSSQPSRTPPTEARITLTGLPDQPGIAGRVFTALADANVNVDMIIQNEPADRRRIGRTCRSPSRATTCRPRARRSQPLQGRARLRRRRDRRAHGQGVAGRRRNEEPSRRRGQDLHRAGRRRA